MHPRMNTPVNSTDPMHSMEKMARAAALLVQAKEILAKAYKEAVEEWQYHRPDCNWTIPCDIEKEAKAALSATQSFCASVHWTINTLRKEAADKDKSHCDECDPSFISCFNDKTKCHKKMSGEKKEGV